MELLFAMKPPNKIMGMVKAGAIEVAVTIFGASAEMKRPIPIPVCATIKIAK